MCLATDASLTADPGVASSIPVRSHTFVEIMKSFLRSFSSLLLYHSRRIVVSYKRKYEHEVLVNCLFKLAQGKSVVQWTDCPAMTIAVDLGRKATKQRNKTNKNFSIDYHNWDNSNRCKGEQPCLHTTHHFDLICMPTKSHQNISKGIRVMERTRFPCLPNIVWSAQGLLL